MNKQQKEVRMRSIDYKDVEFLAKHLNAHGRMKAKRHNHFDAVTQRAFSNAVKRARFMGLLPYVEK